MHNPIELIIKNIMIMYCILKIEEKNMMSIKYVKYIFFNFVVSEL